MCSLQGIEDTLFIPMEARIYSSKYFPEYFYDEKALELEKKIPGNVLEKIRDGSSEYTMLASVARYYNIDLMAKNFIDQHVDKCNIVNLGAGLETISYRLNKPNVNFYEVDLPEPMEIRKKFMEAPENEVNISGDMFELKWTDEIDTMLPTLIIISGVFQYFHENDIVPFISKLKGIFPEGELIFDATNEVGVKYADKYVKKTGNTSAKICFYVNDAEKFAEKLKMTLVEKRLFYTDARKLLKKKIKLYTKIAMRVTDNGNRAILIHLRLN